MRTVLVMTLALSVAGCGWFSRAGGEAARVLPYKAELVAGEDPRDMTISVVAPETATVEAVRESVRFAATRHCLYLTGRSDTEWKTDAATGDWAFRREGETMIFSARCIG
ncbi:MAG: hypothetical protein D6688_04560 [Alphaproteobacteria bacterium]|nr:MAG: hypothetical protein D6688_04560 [Alphaproteobacteria bacterium]